MKNVFDTIFTKSEGVVKYIARPLLMMLERYNFKIIMKKYPLCQIRIYLYDVYLVDNKV